MTDNDPAVYFEIIHTLTVGLGTTAFLVSSSTSFVLVTRHFAFCNKHHFY